MAHRNCISLTTTTSTITTTTTTVPLLHKWQTMVILIGILVITLFTTTTTVAGLRCVHEQCDCKFISGRKFAVCVALDLKELPQCENDNRHQVQYLQEVQAINLTQNHFAQLGPSFFHTACLDNLQKIYLQQVGLQKVDDHAFYPLKNIIELSLSHNSLRRIPSQALENLTALRHLDLSYNNIDQLANRTLKNLNNLRTLFLNNNGIGYIEIDSFVGLNKIEIIKINSNRLTILQPESFLHLRALHTLYLEANNWRCNCRMQPFKRMLLLRPSIKIYDYPRCSTNSVVWNTLNLEHFQCAPEIFRNFSDTYVAISEGSTLRLRCATFVETFGDSTLDEEYLSYTHLNWYWNNIPVTNNSIGCNDHSCSSSGDKSDTNGGGGGGNGDVQKFHITEYIREYNQHLKIKISNLELYSVISLNEGTYICNATNAAGSDAIPYKVRIIPYFSNNGGGNANGDYPSTAEITSNQQQSNSAAAASYDPRISNHHKRINNPQIDNAAQNSDHILFGLALGILSGIFIVLVIFSILMVSLFFRKNKVSHQPQELVPVDAASTGTDNNTVDDNHETATVTTDKGLNTSVGEFNPLLMVNPVQKPPRLGIPDVSSIYSQPSWTMDRATYNRSRYASYAETEPLYSDYYTLYRPNRHLTRLQDNRTFISDTASEV